MCHHRDMNMLCGQRIRLSVAFNVLRLQKPQFVNHSRAIFLATSYSTSVNRIDDIVGPPDFSAVELYVMPRPETTNHVQ